MAKTRIVWQERLTQAEAHIDRAGEYIAGFIETYGDTEPELAGCASVCGQFLLQIKEMIARLRNNF